VFKKQVQEIVLQATVVDERRHLVPYLDRGAFSVFENGAPQAITSFRREDVPVAMGIVINNSGSMRDKRDKVNQAVLNLIRASNPRDEIFVVNFSQNYYLDQDFTSDPGLLERALHQVSMQGSTALYDAIVASAVHLKNNPRRAR
jgi:Ca-activated chloride channel family protein